MNNIVVYEHGILKLGEGSGKLNAEQLNALSVFHGENECPYFSLVNKGVKFCEYVGVLQVGSTTIEILPKTDKTGDDREWRQMLISMLRAVGLFKVHAPSAGTLALKANSVLDLYFEIFILELERLFHKGLLKQYRKSESNSNALKGSLYFSKHISKNYIHQEKFYIKHTIYDSNHKLNQILYKTLKLLKLINGNPFLTGRINSLCLFFPELRDINVSDTLFNTIIYNRKTEDYKKAIDIARLILLNYHPDIKYGNNHVLALMFDMNLLWERFVYISLRKNLSGYTVSPQKEKPFWKPEPGNTRKIKPDILIQNGTTYVLDTKWKILSDKQPSMDDLRQLYVYHQYYDAEKVALVYPGSRKPIVGNYAKLSGEKNPKECSILSLPVKNDISEWQDAITDIIQSWLNQKKEKAYE